MERVIKFRAVLHFDDFNIVVPEVTVYGSGMIGMGSDELSKLLPEGYYIDYDDDCIRCGDENVFTILQGDDWIFVEKHFTLCQFTGEYDKNRKEAYEGDIFIGKIQTGNSFECEEAKYVIEWEDCGFVAKSLTEEISDTWFCIFPTNINACPLAEFEIIGNRFDTPEILNP